MRRSCFILQDNMRCRTEVLRFRDDSFVFGTTSGCAYPSPRQKPKIPWDQFFAASDFLYPQYYWRWPIVPMAGEIDVVNDDEIAAYGLALAKMGVTEGHFYADNANVPVANLAAMKAL
jgi:hypothetical protein